MLPVRGAKNVTKRTARGQRRRQFGTPRVLICTEV
jgi:hypothetical protein